MFVGGPAGTPVGCEVEAPVGCEVEAPVGCEVEAPVGLFSRAALAEWAARSSTRFCLAAALTQWPMPCWPSVSLSVQAVTASVTVFPHTFGFGLPVTTSVLPAVDNPRAPPKTAVLARKNDTARTGWNPHETVLDQAAVQAPGSASGSPMPWTGRSMPTR